MTPSCVTGEPTAGDISERYSTFIEEKIRPYSPQYTVLASAVRDDESTCARIAELPPRCHQPGLLLAVVRLVTGSVPADGPDLLERIRSRWPEIADQMLHREAQGNEVGRCAALLPSFDRIDGPVALLEVGTSAGLCLRPDRYHYVYRHGGEVSELGRSDSAVRLECEIRGSAPTPVAVPEIVWRAGIDPRPIAVGNQDDVAWLDCLVFPDHLARRERLAAAVADARADPPFIVTGDLVDDLADLAAKAPPAAQLVIMHSALLPHVDTERRHLFIDLAASLGAVRIGMEASSTMSALGIGPDPKGISEAAWKSMWVTVDTDVVATAEPYGLWLDSPPG